MRWRRMPGQSVRIGVNTMLCFLIVENGDPKTAEFFYARTGWEALDAAGRAGFDETRGFAIIAVFPVDAVSRAA